MNNIEHELEWLRDLSSSSSTDNLLYKKQPEQQEIQKICPLSLPSGKVVLCLGDRCMWWIERFGEDGCAVSDIAVRLGLLEESLSCIVLEDR